MARFVAPCLLLSVLAAAGAARAGTVYVPVPGLASLGGSTYEVQVSVTNTAAAAREIKETLLAENSDGTQRSGPPATVEVQAGRSSVLKGAGSFRGLAELSGGAEMRYAARLAGTGPGRLGVYLPVITSDNLLKGGQTVALQGLLSGAGRAADVALVNLAQQTAECTAALVAADGTVVAAPVTIELKPLSLRYFPDVLAGAAASEVRAAVSCSREFFAFALLSDAATGELSYVGPGGSGESLLRLPGEEPGCPAAAACFDVKGIVSAPTSAANAEKGVNFLPAAGTYSKLRMTMDVTAGPWWPQNPSALHMLFWLVKDRNYNMFGYASFRGPAKNEAVLRHGIGITHANKAKLVQPITVVEGQTYHLEYTYDTAAQVVDLAITDGGGAVLHLTGPPNVADFSFNGKEKLVLGIGFPGTNPDEAPTFGWVYRDLHVELSR